MKILQQNFSLKKVINIFKTTALLLNCRVIIFKYYHLEAVFIVQLGKTILIQSAGFLEGQLDENA
jgi:hypothetical protein